MLLRAQALTLASQFPKDFPLLVALGHWWAKGLGTLKVSMFFFVFVWCLFNTLDSQLPWTGYIYIYTIIRHVYEYTNHCWLIYWWLLAILYELIIWHKCPNGWRVIQQFNHQAYDWEQQGLSFRGVGWNTIFLQRKQRKQHGLQHRFFIPMKWTPPLKTHWGTKKTDLEDWFWKMVLLFSPMLSFSITFLLDSIFVFHIDQASPNQLRCVLPPCGGTGWKKLRDGCPPLCFQTRTGCWVRLSCQSTPKPWCSQQPRRRWNENWGFPKPWGLPPK